MDKDLNIRTLADKSSLKTNPFKCQMTGMHDIKTCLKAKPQASKIEKW